MSPPPPAKPALVARPPLDVYKKITIIRKPTDAVVYHDSEGNLQRITELGEAATSSAPALKLKTKSDIPTPHITIVKDYFRDVPPTFCPPTSFVRHCPPTAEEVETTVEYNVDLEDEVWLESNPRFGPRVSNPKPDAEGPAEETAGSTTDGKTGGGSTKKHKKRSSTKSEAADGSVVPDSETEIATSSDDEADSKLDDDTLAEPSARPQLSLGVLEQMLDILEKATGFETIITTNEAERLIIQKIPILVHIFGSGVARKGGRRRSKNAVTVRTVVNEVYNYWVQKRSKLKKPLLRKYWPVTASNDTNPHLVFRPREKEKYKLRKKRQNDMDAYRKMKQLRADFDKVRVLLDLVRRRERLSQCMVNMQTELTDQRIYDIVDTSGLPRLSNRLDQDEIEKLLEVPKHFDTSSLDRGKKGRKRKRGGDSRPTSPVPPLGTTDVDIYQQPDASEGVGAEIAPVVAGENHGLPAPLFLHPLESRESFVTEWHSRSGAPFITNYVNSHPTPTFRFQHRPRVGRGGRVIIDRLPCRASSEGTTMHVYTAGDGLNKSIGEGTAPKPLFQLLPKPLDHVKISQRVEQICADALSDDEDTQPAATSASIGTAAAGGVDAEENDGDVILVGIEEWLDTDDQLWGEERFAIGPL